MNKNEIKKRIIKDYFFRVFDRNSVEFVNNELIKKHDIEVGGESIGFLVKTCSHEYCINFIGGTMKFKMFYNNVKEIWQDYQFFHDNRELFCELFTELLEVNITDIR